MKLLVRTVLIVLSTFGLLACDRNENAFMGKAPVFQSNTHSGEVFDLSSRKGKWTVLFFFPKAETPGCTKQVCAFRDGIKRIRDQGAEVYGISSDSVHAQAAFHKNHKLNFTLIADPEGKVISLYGTKMPVVGMSRRWTYIIDPDLNIRSVDKDVDPVLDAKKVAAKIEELKQG